MRTPATISPAILPAVSPAYDIGVVAHVVAGVVGFGAIAVGGYEASRAQRLVNPVEDPRARRFFRGGIDWPGRLIFLVPLIGLALLFSGDRSDLHRAWPWIGLTFWLASAGLATALCWPAERRAQRLLASAAEAEDETAALGAVASFRKACRDMETAAGMISICFLAAVAVMIIQP